MSLDFSPQMTPEEKYMSKQNEKIKSLEKQLKMKQNDWLEACKENDELEKQLTEAEKALSYYADDENWIFDFDTGMPFIREENDGETAREYFKNKEKK